MRAIVEHLTGKGRIIESDCKKLPDGVLCRVTYPICNVGILNRNNRMYEQQVWDNVLQDPDIRQKLETRSLLGHAEHPKDTSQSSTEKVSHVVNKIWDDHKGKVATELDVLDTPYGRICDTLLRAGCGLGVSTRAEGELEETTVEGKQIYRVVPEAYSLKTIDFTADPSTYGAYPESVERDLVNQIGAGVKEKKIDQEYATVMLESMVVKEAKALLENIKSDRHHKDCKCNPTEKKCTSGCTHANEAHKPDCDCGFCKKVAANKAKAEGKAVPAVVVKEVQVTEVEWICPHCNKFIGEKELYQNEKGEDFHSPCKDKGPISLPESKKLSVKEAVGMPGLAVEEPVKAVTNYAEMGDEALVGLARDYEAAIEKDSITQEMWKELGMIYNELRRRSKPVEALEKALKAHIIRISEMMPGLAPVYTGGLGTAPGMNEEPKKDEISNKINQLRQEQVAFRKAGDKDRVNDLESEIKDLEAKRANLKEGKRSKDPEVNAFMTKVFNHPESYADDTDSVEAAVRFAKSETNIKIPKSLQHLVKKAQESIKEEKGDGHHAIVNFEELYAKFQEMDLFTDAEVKDISESKTQIGLVEKITKVVEHIKRDLVIAKAERDTALSLGNSEYEALMENYTKDIQALTKQIQEAQEVSAKAIEANAKKLKESIEKVATKVAVEVKAIYEAKLLKAKSHYESEISRMKLECNETIFQRTVVDAKVKESGLKDLPENAVTLLRRCKSEAEVDVMIDQFRYAIKESFAHSGKPANISIDGSEQAESPLLDQTRMMLEVLNPKPVK